MDMMKAPFIADIIRISQEIYTKGWGEANGGNISIHIPLKEMAPFEHSLNLGSGCRLPFAVPDLAGDYFLVTGTGIFFRNIPRLPQESLGIIKIDQDGTSYTTVWGYLGGGRPTSELSAHLLSHTVRQKITGGRSRIILHTHTTNLIALSFLLPLETALFSRELWEMMSECLVLFPDGIGVLPWMIPGQLELGHETAKLMEKHRLVLWAHHGIFGAGQNMDQVFGLIETAEKAAEMLIKVMGAGGKRQAISGKQLQSLAQAFKLCPMMDLLDSTVQEEP